MAGRGKSLGGGSKWSESYIPESEIDKKLSEIVGDNVRDLRELSRKSNQDLDEIVEKYTGKLLERLEG